MGKLTAEQAQQLKDLEAMRDADDDDETVVWVRQGNHETRLTGDRAVRWLRKNGYDEDDADESSQGAPLPAKSVPAKKAAAPAADGPAEPVEGAELEQDAPEPTRRRFF